MEFFVRIGVIVVLFFSIVFTFGFDIEGGPALLSKNTCDQGFLCVHFFDVGQGDATFIESPTGVQVLIDGGPDSSVLRELSKKMSFFDRTIDVVVATHPDQDHIGGLVDVLDRYEVGIIMLTENENDTPVSEMFLQSIEAEGAEILFAHGGMTLELGDGAELAVLFPDRNPEKYESNLSSIVSQLRYGETEFLFTGDSPKSVEQYLISMLGEKIESEVLQVGHHGSKTSTAAAFAAAVDPDYAVISAGKDNRYGHPHREVLDILESGDIEIKNTAEGGSITFVSGGEAVRIE